MKAVIPNLITPIVRNDGIAAQTMRAWMESIGVYVNLAMTGGAVVGAYSLKTSAYSVLATDFTIDCDGTFSVSLPSASLIAGKIYNIKNSGTGIITVTPAGAETIDGGATAVLMTQYENITIQSTGANWIIL